MIGGPIGGSGSTIGFARRDDYGKSVTPSNLLSNAYIEIDEAKESGAEKDALKAAETAAKAYLDAWRSMEQFKSWAITIYHGIKDTNTDQVTGKIEEAMRACGLTSAAPDYYILAPSEIMHPFNREALIAHLDTMAKNGDAVRQTMLKLAEDNLEAALNVLKQPPETLEAPAAKSDARLAQEKVEPLPFRYRLAFPNSPRRCANCEFFKASSCSYYQQAVLPDYVCDSWQETYKGSEVKVETTADSEKMRSITGKWQAGDMAYSRHYHAPVRVVSSIKDSTYYQVTMLTRGGKAIGTALVPSTDLKSTRSIKEWQMGQDFDYENAPSHPVEELKGEVERVLKVFDEITSEEVITDSGTLNPLRELLAYSLGSPLWVKVDTGQRRRYYRAMQTALSAIAAARQLLFTAYRHHAETQNSNYGNTYIQIQERVQSARKTLQDSLADTVE